MSVVLIAHGGYEVRVCRTNGSFESDRGFARAEHPRQDVIIVQYLCFTLRMTRKNEIPSSS